MSVSAHPAPVSRREDLTARSTCGLSAMVMVFFCLDPFIYIFHLDKCEAQTLVGCNAGISSVDFDPDVSIYFNISIESQMNAYSILIEII